MPSLTAHIINHTHWDREWFLTAEYTSQWIPGLIESLERLVAENPDFRFFLDGQTLVIEDLLKVSPAHAERAKTLIQNGNLLIGPYYCQPDWQITGGELLVRNLLLGLRDVKRYGGRPAPGWLIDTFGHTSQTPQLHRLFGIDSAYVWRGVPQLEPYFTWQSPDGSHLFTINLFGGYRNLYGVSHMPEVAVERLRNEVAKLQPFYPTGDIPLFDGYDLEDNPEDPIRFYAQWDSNRLAVALNESSPLEFAETIKAKLPSLPTLYGELNSGKYGATFPGTFSTRTYLKLMAYDCDRLLFQVCEPLAVLARLQSRPYHAAQYEAWSRTLMQNAVHDCICGVSIDQVHEKMELSYRQVFDALVEDVEESLGAILSNFAAGVYAVSTNPIPSETWQITGNEMFHAKTDGIGVWPVTSIPLEAVNQPLDSFVWQNDHYTATVRLDGTIQVEDAVFGSLVVSAEHGDTYSDQRGERLGALQPVAGPVIEWRSDNYCVIRYEAEWCGEHASARATVCLHFDPSPLIRWQIDLDSQGVDLRIEMAFETRQIGAVRVGAPFDVIERAAADTDLLPRHLPDDLASVLIGQRELNAVESFPFHDFISIGSAQSTVSVLAKGLRAYRVEAPGRVLLGLRRSVEWLTKANLRDRVGDAGPFFYVPDARCERGESHEVAVAFGPAGWIDTTSFQSLVAAYKTPPILVQTSGGGSETGWTWLKENVPLSGLYIDDETILARFYNPTAQSQPLHRSYMQINGQGRLVTQGDTIPPKQIITVQFDEPLPTAIEHRSKLAPMMRPHWRVGRNVGLPDPAILEQLEGKIASLEAQGAAIEAQLATAPDMERLHLQHRWYILKRESVELQLSLALNRRKLAQQGTLTREHLYMPDPDITEIGLNLNQLRIKRRIFDYIVQVRREGSG